MSDELADQANSAWNDVIEGRARRPTDSEHFGEVIARVHAWDDAPAIDPFFSRRLAAQLREKTPMSAQGLRSGAAKQIAHTWPLSAAVTGEQRTPKSWSLQRTVPTAVSWLVLALVIVGVASVDQWRQPNRPEPGTVAGGAIVATPKQQALVATQTSRGMPDGYPRGNAAGTGEMAGVGPIGAPSVAWRSGSDLAGFAIGATFQSVIVVGDRLVAIAHGDDDTVSRLVTIRLSDGTETVVTELDRQQISIGAVVGNRAVIAWNDGLDGSGHVMAYELDGTRPRWSAYRADAGLSTETLSATADAVVFVAGDSVIALDADTGDPRWTAPLPAALLTPEGPRIQARLVTDGSRLLGFGNGLAFALDADDGSVVWTAVIDGWGNESPLVDDGVFVVSTIENDLNAADGVGTGGGRVYGIDAESGTRLWGPIERPNGVSLAAGGGRVYTANSDPETGTLDAFDIAAGTHLWTTDAAQGFRFPVYAGGSVWAGVTADGTTLEVDAETGRVTWGVLAGDGPGLIATDRLVVVDDGVLVAIEGDGNVDYAPDGDTYADLTGDATCALPREAPRSELGGEPTLSLDVVWALDDRPGGAGMLGDGRPAPWTEWPQVLSADAPDREAPTPETMSAIDARLDLLTACENRGNWMRSLPEFFTDDFFRRGVVAWSGEGYLVYPANLMRYADPDSARRYARLDDGRIAAFIGEPGTFGWADGQGLLIFAETSDGWLIDEAYLVVDHYDFSPMG